MDITPAVNLLKSLRGERINYVLLVGEACDNAFDAGASRIAVEISDEAVSFKDNGCGITRDRIAAIVSDEPTATLIKITELHRRRVAIRLRSDNAAFVRTRLLSHRDDWALLAESFLRYKWLDDARRPPNNSRVLQAARLTANGG
jgi:hypothetical protein